ncbi:MAG: F0F1 ATP synthase subunit A [Alphaproteobacteria bacterium]|nr:F0F1 ATP synthase subunit A [Alphaproteobacteria bacterium]
MTNPMLQFFQKPLCQFGVMGWDLTLTNGVLFMFVSLFGVVAFCSILYRAQMQPSRWQMLVEKSFFLVAGMIGPVNDQLTKQVLPFTLSIFLIVVFGNVVGLVPGAFTFTSQLIVTMFMAIVVFLVSIVLGIKKRGLKFFKQFVPHGVSAWLYPLIIPVEILSFFTRPLSLGLRLFVNMVAGHSILAVFASFIAGISVISVCVGLLNAVLFVLEVSIAVLQGYVFSVLSSLYLQEAVKGH